jgi:hypothetical protein
MASGDERRLRITAHDDSGAEVAFRVWVVTVSDGRLGCRAADELVRLVERDPRVDVEGAARGTAVVVRSGRLYAEVHGRLRRARRLPGRASSGPVLLIRPERGSGQAKSA